MDENNQYGFAMTKPLPYGCIKKNKKLQTLEELKELLANVILTDKLGHLFVVDIVFDKVNEKTLLFNELYPPIFEKKTKKLNRLNVLVHKLCVWLKLTKKESCGLYSKIQKLTQLLKRKSLCHYSRKISNF